MSNNNSILKGMKDVLIKAHNTNNAKAISKDFAAGAGVDEKVFTSWCTWIETLHVKVTPWAEAWNNGDVSDDDINKIYDDVMPVLKQLSRVDNKLFLRTNEVGAICKMAHEFGKSDNGSIDVVRGKVAFRRQIETMIGNRIAQNEAVTEDDYKIILKYDSAVKNQKKAEDRLNGYTDKRGAAVIGLKDRLKEAEKTLDDMKKLVKVKEDTKDDDLCKEYPILSGYVATVNGLKADIKSAEGQIDRAKTTIKENKKKYQELMSKINKA